MLYIVVDFSCVAS